MGEIQCSEAAQDYPVIRGFGYVYCTQPLMWEALGSAIGEEKGNEQLLQTFERGWAMRIGEWDDSIVVLTDDEQWQHFPGRGAR